MAVDAIWRTRYWTTNPPVYDPHHEWSVEATLRCAEPIRVAIVTGDDVDGSVEFDVSRGTSARIRLGRAVELQPTVEQLADAWTVLGVRPPGSPTTWSSIPLRAATPAEPAVTAIVVARRDTRLRRRGHWRVREDLLGDVTDDMGAIDWRRP